MGKKNHRTPTTHRKPEEPPPVKEEATVVMATEMKLECERALTALRRGNYNKALRLMKEASVKFDNSAMFHRISATISAKVSGIIDDPNAKQRHLRSAIESAKRAVSMTPNSVEYAHFYANLLYEAANDAKDYDEVIGECERALAIENPNDPAKDSLSDETVVFTAEAREVRVTSLQSELKTLVQKSNIASISTWMKNLSGSVCQMSGDDKFRLIPLRRTAEDPVEMRYLSGNGNVRRPNEIKKANKTLEEKRKEIEVRVAAARLLQQKNEQGGVGEESKGSTGGGLISSNGGVASGSGSVNGTSRVGERRRHGNSRRISTYSERKDQVLSFWNSMKFEQKRDLLSVRVSDFKAHFSGFKDGRQACEVLSEAIAFGEMNKTWRFWACCRCGERFTEAHAHTQHIIQDHIGNLLPKTQSIFPLKVDSEWADMLLNCSWKPLDLAASIRMLEDQSKSEDSDFSRTDDHKERIDDCWSESFCSEEGWESFHEKRSFIDNGNGSFWENRGEDGNLNMDCKTCDQKEGPKVYDLTNNWPLSDDTERAKLLDKIKSFFQVLITHNCLSVTHLRKVLEYTMCELQGLYPGSHILSCGVDQTPLCICFLEAPFLRRIINFLKELNFACGFSEYSEKFSLEDAIPCPPVSDNEDRIILDESASFLILDESLLNPSTVRDGGGSGNSLRKGDQSDSDLFLSWIYAGSRSADQLASWIRICEERSHEGTQLLEILGKEYMQLQNLCDKKSEVLGYEEALLGLEDLCVDECKKREQASEMSYRSYDSILRKRRDELCEGEKEVWFGSKRLEVDVISNVLKDAESLAASRFGFEDTYGGVASHLCDLEAGDEDWRSKDYLQQLDSCIDSILQNQKEQMSNEIFKLDVQILHRLENVQQLQLKLEPVSAFDYRFILIPLVKSFMRAHIEDLAEKDATEKSDAAREAFLAELALDSKKANGSGNDNSKNTQEKVKEKKRFRDSRRIKDSKVGSFSDQVEAAEQLSLAAALDGDLVGRDAVESETNAIVKELDDVRRKLELEAQAEAQKLEETLEYQRRLENEAKRLAEQRKCAPSEDALEELGIVSVISGVTVGKQEPILLKNLRVDNVDSLGRNLRDGSDAPHIGDDEFAESAISNLRLGSPTSVDQNHAALPFERQTGKKGKRRNATKVPDGKYQIGSYGKENVKLENSTADIMQNDSVWNLDGAFNESAVADGASKTFRQLKAEEDEEERFQADLKKAVMQSLDTFQARQKIPLVPNSRAIRRSSPDSDAVESKTDGLTDGVNEGDIVGMGLQNDVGEYNCFLNVIIQSLWHLKRFREEFLRRSTSEHVHVGDPCVICALFDILTALSMASGDSREPVAPTMLRTALSNLYPKSNFFQEGQMNDASEVLAVIFDCLHQSFTSASGKSDSDSVESKGSSWDCSSASCIAHTLFGMDIMERMNCYTCGLESKHLKYTSFFHNVNASALRTMKSMSEGEGHTFEELLNLVEMNHQVACDSDVGGCRKLNHIHHILSNPPHVFTTVLGWQNTSESVDDIKATVAALSTEIDISILYRGLDPQKVHRLVSVVCYYGQHYHCFAYSHDYERWFKYDDNTVKPIGTWKDVISMCERGHLQPQVLFYEAVN